jgi:hypothetical protein
MERIVILSGGVLQRSEGSQAYLFTAKSLITTI